MQLVDSDSEKFSKRHHFISIFVFPSPFPEVQCVRAAPWENVYLQATPLGSFHFVLRLNVKSLASFCKSDFHC